VDGWAALSLLPPAALEPPPGIAGRAEHLTHGYARPDRQIRASVEMGVLGINPQIDAGIAGAVAEDDLAPAKAVRALRYGNHSAGGCGDNWRPKRCRHIDAPMIGFAAALRGVIDGPLLVDIPALGIGREAGPQPGLEQAQPDGELDIAVPPAPDAAKCLPRDPVDTHLTGSLGAHQVWYAGGERHKREKADAEKIRYSRFNHSSVNPLEAFKILVAAGSELTFVLYVKNIVAKLFVCCLSNCRRNKELGTLGRKRELLERGRFKYNFERMIYFNRDARMAFSVEFIEDHDPEELERYIGENSAAKDWCFHFNEQPSDSVKRELVNDLA